MLAFKRTTILGIVVFLIVWTVLLSIGQVVVGASEANATLPPTLVSPANNTWVTENKPTFTWILNDSQSGFNLQISNETNFVTLTQNNTVKSSTQNYTLTTALNDGTYYWRVRTNDTSGIWSIWSDVWLVKIDTVSPSVSDDAPIGWQTTKPITVTLTASDATSGVSKVYYKKWLVGTTEPVNYTEGTSIVLDTDDKWNIKYKAVDVAGNSAEKAKEVWIDTTVPNPVTVLPPRKWIELEVKELEIGGGEFVELNWTASDDPYFMRYEIYILKVPLILPDMTPNATITDAYSTTYTIEGLDPDTTYHLSVVVVDQAGLSSPAATVSVTTKAPMNWLLMGGIAVAVEVAIAAILVIIKVFIKKE